MFQYNLHFLEPDEFDNILSLHLLEIGDEQSEARKIKKLLYRTAETLLDNYDFFLTTQLRMMEDPEFMQETLDPLVQVAEQNEIDTENRSFNKYVLELFYQKGLPLDTVQKITRASPDELQEILFPLAVSNAIH